MATSGKPPKVMSNRLSGMKFMQRGGGSPSAPSTLAEPAPKRQRLSNGSSLAVTPATGDSRGSGHNSGIDAAQSDPLNKEETQWYLSYKSPQTPASDIGFRIVSAGYSALDAIERSELPNDENEDNHGEQTSLQFSGRKSFGKFSRRVEKTHNTKQSASEADSSEEEEDDPEDIEDDPTGVKALIAKGRKEAADRVRAERRAKRLADSASSTQLAAARRKKELTMNRSGGISSGGSRMSTSSSGFANMVCHRCGQTGHPKRECPQRPAR